MKCDKINRSQNTAVIYLLLLLLTVTTGVMADEEFRANEAEEPNQKTKLLQKVLDESGDKDTNILKETEEGNKSPAAKVSESVNPYRVLIMQVDGFFVEKPDVKVLTLSEMKTHSITSFNDKLIRAATDENVDAVLFNFDQPFLNWAQIDELHQAISRFRKSGKKTYAYLESVGQSDYLLASACEEIVMTPTGEVMMTGLSLESIHFKDILEKLGIKADFVQIGDYKAAAEPLTLSKPSEEYKQQINYILDALYQHLIDTIALSRNLTQERVRDIIDQGPFNAEQAKKLGLIDRIQYRDEFIETVKKESQKQIAFIRDYNEPKKKIMEASNPWAMMGALQELFSGPPVPSGPAIAVIYVDGPITLGTNSEGFGSYATGARTIREALATARRDKNIKAIVIRIDSPGGSATASDIIYKAIQKATDPQEPSEIKPVVVSMGAVAASGGYYIACGAPTIFAQPSTITGSIGVIGGKIVLGKLLEKIGITTYQFHRGRRAEMFSAEKPFTSMERFKIAGDMQWIYDIFKERVNASRKERLTEPIENLAQGKIYTGVQARKLGLVDEIGGLSEALAWAAKKAEIDDYHIRVLPRPKTLMEIIEHFFAQAEHSAQNPTAALAGQLIPPKQFGRQSAFTFSQSQHSYILPYLLGVPAFKKTIQNALSMLELLQQENNLLLMPYNIVIDR